MFRPKHFGLEELVYPEIYMEYQDKDMLWVLWRNFDDRFLMTADQLRGDFGSTFLNTWSFGKMACFGDQIFYHSCLRPGIIPDGEKWAEETSHKQWNTGDFKIEKYANLPDQEKLKAYNNARQYIINHHEKYPYVTALESGVFTPRWIHITTGNHRKSNGKIRIIKP